MNYQFRFTFSHTRPGFFPFEDERKILQLPDGQSLQLVARDTERLIDATRFHLEMGGFPDEESAKREGRHLRIRLQILNAALNLGLVIPVDDSTSARASDEIKKQALEESGVALLDSIVGLGVFPADGRHGEFVVAGEAKNRPSDPEYVLNALKNIWPHQFQFNVNQIDALEMRGRATSEVSPRTRFLLCYLALERMVKPAVRNADAIDLLKTFVEQAEAKLSEDEAKSLVGALTSLHTNSVPSALRQLAKRLESPKEIGGRTFANFFAECVEVRNKIAHDASPKRAATLETLASELRQVVLMLIWTESKLPPVTFTVPPSQVEVTKMRIRIL